MTTEVKGLEDLKSLKKDAVIASASQENTEPKKPVKDKLGRSYATGKRKNAVARVWIRSGKGSILINGKEAAKYFTRSTLQTLINQPLTTADRQKTFDVMATVKGGGIAGQAGAIRHGISKALILFEPELRAVLKREGFLTRDSRVVERKKYGRRKARRKPQFSKR